MKPLAQRIIIVESALIGLPISAPLEQSEDKQIPKVTMRWRNTGTSFVLEQWRLENPRGPTRGIWVEVPCVMSASDDA